MQRPLIRIVDDDKALAGSFGLLLETMGWDTAAYTSGRRFLNNDDLSRPGCIVLDVRMPGLTGPEIQDKLIEMGCSCRSSSFRPTAAFPPPCPRYRRAPSTS